MAADPKSDPRSLVREADKAAAQGDVARAKSLLELAVAAPDAPDDATLKLAAMRRAAGDLRGALHATEIALQRAPSDFTALLLRAHLLEATNAAEADLAYDRAIAQRPAAELPQQLAVVAAHAETRSQVFRAETLARLAKIVDEAAPDLDADQRQRLARFRTNATRTTRVYHSEPTDFHYPGLIEREYHERSLFNWVGRLEALTDVIAAELDALMSAERRELVPYVEYAEHHPLHQWRALNHSLDWSALHLIRNGERVEANARHCPETLALLATLPQPRILGASPNALFSLLAPGARIPPHTGIANTRLVCHLPLTVPEGCWFRVGAETRTWRRGEAWIFDDTIEHEAANDTAALRVILIFDLWHPGLTEIERRAVAAMIGAYGAGEQHGL